MLTYLKGKIGEHSSQIALGATFGALAAYFDGKVDLNTCLITVASAAIAFFLPVKQ